MNKTLGLHRYVARRFFVMVAPALPEIVWCEKIYFKRWEFSGKALALVIPNEDTGMALYAKHGIMQSAARELGIPVILVLMKGRHFAGPIDCRQESEL